MQLVKKTTYTLRFIKIIISSD